MNLFTCKIPETVTTEPENGEESQRRPGTELPGALSHIYMAQALERLLADLATAQTERAALVANHVVALLYNTAVHYHQFFDRRWPLTVDVTWEDGTIPHSLQIVLAREPLYSLSAAEAVNGRAHVRVGEQLQFDLEVLAVTSAAALLSRVFRVSKISTRFRGLSAAAVDAKPLVLSELRAAEGGKFAKDLEKDGGHELALLGTSRLAITLNTPITATTGTLFFNHTVFLVVLDGQLERVKLNGGFTPEHLFTGHNRGLNRSLLSIDVANGCIARWWYADSEQLQIPPRRPAYSVSAPLDTLCGLEPGPHIETVYSKPAAVSTTSPTRLEFKRRELYRVWPEPGSTTLPVEPSMFHGEGPKYQYKRAFWGLAHDLRRDTRTCLQGSYDVYYNEDAKTFTWKQV